LFLPLDDASERSVTLATALRNRAETTFLALR
jgi:hypothetical protein